MAALGDRYRGRAFLCLVLGFLATSIVGLFSNGVYHEDDLSHFLCARWAQHDARYLLDVWARPGFTLLYALPAMIGPSALAWHLARLLSALLHAGTAWIAYRIATRYGLRHAWLAVPLLYAQPLPTLLSLTTLTETPLAFYLAAGTLLLLNRRPMLSALIVSLAPLARQDAVLFLPLWALAIYAFPRGPARGLGQRLSVLAAYPCLLVGLGLQNGLGSLWLDPLPLTAYLQPAGATHYGHGTPLTFLTRTFVCIGPVVVALALLGLRRFLSRPLAWLPVAGCVLFVLLHTVIYACGAFSSGGYARFLVALGPWFAVMAVAGMDAFQDNLERPRERNWRLVAILLVAFWLIAACEMALRPPEVRPQWQTAVQWLRLTCWVWSVFLIWAAWRLGSARLQNRRRPAGVFVVLTVWLLLAAQVGWALRPLRQREEHRIVAQTVAWADASHSKGVGHTGETPAPHSTWLAAQNWVYYWSDRWVPQGDPPIDQQWQRATPGTLLFWDARFCRELATPLTLEALRAAPEWQERHVSRALPGANTPYMIVFERAAAQPKPSPLSKTPLSLP